MAERCHSKTHGNVTASDRAVSVRDTACHGQGQRCHSQGHSSQSGTERCHSQGHSGVTERGRAVSKAYNGITARDIAESHKDSAVSVRDSGVKSETEMSSQRQRCHSQGHSGVRRTAVSQGMQTDILQRRQQLRIWI